MGTVQGAVVTVLGYNVLMRHIVDDVGELAGGLNVLPESVMRNNERTAALLGVCCLVCVRIKNPWLSILFF